MADISDFLYFLDRFIDPKLTSGLWWCGSYDGMETVGINAVSKTVDASWSEVGLCKAFVDQFPFILVAVPPGAQQEEIAGELLARFSAFVCVPADEAWQGCASVVELKEKGGQAAVDRLLMGCRELPVNGLHDAVQQIDKWLDNRVFLTDIQTANAHDEDNILSLFEYAHRRWHCTSFIVDNIMTAALKDEAKLGQWRAQSVFASRLVAFAQRFDVHVHLVAHPRKTKDGNFDSDDVAGTSDITNRASNVFRVGRIPDEKVEEMGCRAGTGRQLRQYPRYYGGTRYPL